LTRLALSPDEVVPDRGRQLGFWGEETEAEQRAARALARIQGLLGPEAVHTARLRGGRDPADRVTLTPAEAPPSGPPHPGPPAPPPPPLSSPPSGSPSSGVPASGPSASTSPAPDPAASRSPGGPGHGPPGAPGGGSGDLRGAVPWPGQVPAPAPAIVYAEPLPAEVVDADGGPGAREGRGLLACAPRRSL